jgi:hypothetical protein
MTEDAVSHWQGPPITAQAIANARPASSAEGELAGLGRQNLDRGTAAMWRRIKVA